MTLQTPAHQRIIDSLNSGSQYRRRIGFDNLRDLMAAVLDEATANLDNAADPFFDSEFRGYKLGSALECIEFALSMNAYDIIPAPIDELTIPFIDTNSYDWTKDILKFVDDVCTAYGVTLKQVQQGALAVPAWSNDAVHADMLLQYLRENFLK